jgi:hypothetical protein
LGSTKDRLDTMTNIGASTAPRPSPPTETTTSSACAAAIAMQPGAQQPCGPEAARRGAR